MPNTDIEKQVGVLTKKVDDLTKALEAEKADKAKAEAELAEANKALEAAKAKADMKDEDKEFLESLEDEEDKKKFLEADASKRADMVAKAKSNDETLKVGDRIIRKSAVGDDVFATLKAQQEALDKNREAIEAANKARLDAEMADVAKSKYPHVAGSDEDRIDMLKAMHGMPEATRKRFEKVFEANEKLAKAAFEAQGTAHSYVPGDDHPVAKARNKYDQLVAKEMETNNVTKSVAQQRVAQDRPDLVKEYNGS